MATREDLLRLFSCKVNRRRNVRVKIKAIAKHNHVIWPVTWQEDEGVTDYLVEAVYFFSSAIETRKMIRPSKDRTEPT